MGYTLGHMSHIDTDSKKIAEVLSRGVEKVVDTAHLEERLKSGKQLRIKLGIDPTSPNIHLGRSIPLLKLRDFQELGHQVVLIIGDSTGIIGDTSDKDSERPMLTEEIIKKNLETYIDQAGKVIDIKKTEICYNSKWLDKLDYGEIGKQADAFSLNDFISRENIAKRLKDGKRISLRELLYPLMQGYDSVAVKADVELGGTDQWFNLLAGRDLQRVYGQEPQDIVTNPLIEGLDGRKMSSSWGNTVNLFDAPNDMFGKLMSLRDESIVNYFTLLTRVDMSEVKDYETRLTKGENPRDIKIALAKEIVRMYHDEKAATQAEEYFIKTFSKKEVPDEMPEVEADGMNIVDALVTSGVVTSKSDARRAIEQKGVRVNQEVIEDFSATLKKGDVVQKGKIHFFRVK